MCPDYYGILGIDRDAAPERVRRAYHAAVKECHPDASGTGSSAERFRAVEEAYETLRDRGRREAYDRTLGRREPEVRRSEGPAPAARTDPSGPVLDVLLSVEEAAGGTRVPVDVPILMACPRCGGLGVFCAACGGSGRVRSVCRVDLEIPAGVDGDTDFCCELGLAGDGGPRFAVHVDVEPAYGRPRAGVSF